MTNALAYSEYWNMKSGIFDLKNPYSFGAEEKNKIMIPYLIELCNLHKTNCNEYSRIVNSLFDNSSTQFTNLSEIPFLPVRAFKEMSMKSVYDNEIVKTLTSSGTSGQNTSKIYLDKLTAIRQSNVLISLTSQWLGPKRRPMLIFDTAESTKNRYEFNARAAGILGFSQFGRKPVYALGSELNLEYKLTKNYIQENHQNSIFGFGFTFVIWKYVYKELIKKNLKIDMGDKSVILHGGGWKKIENESVSREVFNESLTKVLGARKIINYYGMVEQVGSIFFECESGYFHTPNFSEILIRDPITYKPLAAGNRGLIQLISLLPSSYPGHSILTEDIGEIVGIDNCKCGKPGKYFVVHGRQEQAEPRGCSDVAA